MFNWFKKPATPPAQVPAQKRRALFSTDVPAPDSFFQDSDMWLEYLKLSFQVTPKDFKPTSGDGTVVATFDAAMAPIKDKPGSFAMDEPSAGNPLSMKPLLQPINNIPFMQLAWFASQGFVGWQICAMVAQHWLVNKACAMPGNDAVRHGYELTSNDGNKLAPEVLRKIRKLDKKYKINKNLKEMVKFARVFGIRIVMFKIDTDDANFYEKPFNIDGVKKGGYLGISQIDPYWVSPVLDAEAMADPSSIHFYEPTYWQINGRKIHRTHLVIMRNSDVADILKPTYMYGGIPVPQMISERVYAAERTANEAPMLALTKRLYVQKLDILQAIANQTEFQSKMEWSNATRDNFGMLAVGQEDEVEQFETSLTDLDEVIMTQYKIVAAASDVPASKLLGESPKGGLGSEGTYDADSYHEFLESLQENNMSPLLDRHYELLARSESTPEVEHTWNAVDSPSAKEQAEINNIKADTGSKLATTGAILGADERQRLIADKDSGYNGMEEVIEGGPGDYDSEIERANTELANAAKTPDADKD